MKTSWNNLVRFAVAANGYIANSKDTKLAYAINRVLPQAQKAQAAAQEAIADIEVDTCVTEKIGGEDVIVRDAQGNLRYTVEGIKKRNRLTREYQDGPNLEIEPHLVSDLSDSLTDEQLEAFAGFVIPAEKAEAMMAQRRGDPVRLVASA